MNNIINFDNWGALLTSQCLLLISGTNLVISIVKSNSTHSYSWLVLLTVSLVSSCFSSTSIRSYFIYCTLHTVVQFESKPRNNWTKPFVLNISKQILNVVLCSLKNSSHHYGEQQTLKNIRNVKNILNHQISAKIKNWSNTIQLWWNQIHWKSSCKQNDKNDPFENEI